MEALESLLRRFVEAGDSAAMDTLVNRTRRRLLAAARRIGTPQDAEDSVQAAYHSLLRRASQPFDAPVMPWLLTTVVRIAYRRKAVNARETALAERLAQEPAEDDPAAGASEAERATLLRAEVARLPAKYRDPIVLHHFEGLTTAEIARLLEAPQATVKARLQRGRRLLRGRLHPIFGAAVWALPWWIADHKVPLATGGLVTGKKIGVTAALVALLSVGFLATRALHERPATQRDSEAQRGRDIAMEPDPLPREVVRAEREPPTERVSEPSSASGPATLRVRVIDDRGRPIRFASILLHGADQTLEPSLRRNGRAAFEKLARHVNWELAVRYVSYTPYRAPVDLTSPGELVVTLRRPPERVLAVEVVDTSGEALPRYFVMVSHDAGNAMGETDEDGTVDLNVRGDIWSVRTGRREQVIQWEAEARELPATQSAVRLVVADTAVIRGRVLRPDGKPYARARLRVERDGRLVTRTTAAADGEFVIYQPVAAAPVDILYLGAQVEVEDAIQLQEDLAHAGRLTGVPAASTGLVLRTQKAKLARMLDVQVQTEDRAAVANARVLAWIETAWLGRREGRTDARGMIRLGGLAARGFSLEIEPPEGSGLLRRVVFVPAEGSRVTVTLLRKVTLTGTVRFRGIALHGAGVYVEVDGEKGRPVVADELGRFSLDVPADSTLKITLHVYWTGEHGLRSWSLPLRDRAATIIDLDAR